MKYKAIVIIKASNTNQAIASHLLEYEHREECETAIEELAKWAGYYEVIRLYTKTYGV